jgi:hypothetical protein
MRGIRIGDLYVVAFAPPPNRSRQWCFVCVCTCGAEVIATGSNLRRGKQSRCHECSYLNRFENRRKRRRSKRKI